MKNSIKTTTDSRTYKLMQRKIIADMIGGCWICGPHQGCNYSFYKKSRSWKRFRKTQWKER